MKDKKVMALILAAAMTVGCSMTAFAADANGAESEGTSFDHVNKDVIDVTLPTDTQVATVFDYYVDPEGAIKSAGSLLNGTTVTGNDDGVYFVNAGAAAVPGTVSCTIAGKTGAKATVSDLTTNEKYTYKNVAAQAGTVSCSIAADANAIATVDDATINETYAYDSATSKWFMSDGTTEATVVITVKDSSGATLTPGDGDTVTVSGATPAGQKWQKEDGTNATVTISVTESDGTTPITPAVGDTVTVSGATAAGLTGYSSSSDAVQFEGKNSVNVDITVAAAVTATDADKDIALVADEAALAAATGPALLMTLKVGSDTKVITSTGTSAKATIAGVAGNFVMKPNAAGNNYEFVTKPAADLTAWDSTTVQLVGKTNSKDIPAGANAMTVPKITLTWTVAKSTAPAGPSASGNLSTSNKSVTISGLGENVTLKSASLTKADDSTVAMTSGTHYRFSNGTFEVIKEAHLSSTSFKSWVLTFSDDSTVTVPIVAAQ